MDKINFKINEIQLKLDGKSFEIEGFKNEVQDSLDKYQKEKDPFLKERSFIIYKLKVEQLKQLQDFALGLQNEKVELHKQINIRSQLKSKY